MMRRVLVALLLSLLSLSVRGGEGSKVQRYVDSLMATEQFSSIVAGICAEYADGRPVVRYGDGKMLVPASNLKLVTTGTALHELGSSFRFRTELAIVGDIADGVLKGDLYIVGGGDPTLFSGDPGAVPEGELYGLWRAMLARKGIRKIEGDIIGDGRFFDGQSEEGSWLYEDIGTYYGTGSDALCYFRNEADFMAETSSEVGAALKIVPSYPRLPWMKYTWNCTVGKAGTGDRLYLYTAGDAPAAEMRGTLGKDIRTKKIRCSNKFGAYSCAWMFRNNLVGNGMAVEGKAAYVDRQGFVRTEPGGKAERVAAGRAGMEIIGETFSPELSQIVRITNYRSDNFYAEAIFRILGKSRSGSASYGASSEAETVTVREMGLDPSAFSPVDGSGLSRKNLVSAGFVCRFLRAMLASPSADSFIASLPHPSAKNAGGADPAIIFYKTGSMDGVRCWSGYVITEGKKSEAMAFSLMFNNFTLPSAEITRQLGVILGMIAEEACRR